MSRRLRTESVQRLLRDVERRLLNRVPASCVRWIDAKPLPIGGSSQDGDAGYGRAAGCMAKGYKLHAIADRNQGFVAWTVRPMNVNARKVAPEWIAQLEDEGYLAGDGEYDGNALYDAAADRGVQLLAPRRRGTRLGHKRHGPHRLRAVELLSRDFGVDLLRTRDAIDRMFGQLTNPGWGLKPLPNRVRTQLRVTLRVQGKMIFYHTYRLLKPKEVA